MNADKSSCFGFIGASSAALNVLLELRAEAPRGL
jgi:hypothetical protein